jgi:hypothetical protein
MRALIATVSLIAMFAGQVSGQPIKCGWGMHPPAAHDRIAAASFFRTDRHQSYISPDSAFMVHYDTSGSDAPDLTSTRPDGVPDWVVELAVALDSVRSLLLALGFDPAWPDDDGIYDIYLQENNGGLYGEIFFPDSHPEGGYITYIEMDNDFAEDESYFTHGLDAARVTCAHEYFHAVQLAQDFKGADSFLYELFSTWLEEVAFPEVNDWVGWFDTNARGYIAIGNDPEQSMTVTSGYDLAIFGHYLTNWAPDTLDIMQRIWERFRSTTAQEAISQALAIHGGSLTSAWTDCIGRQFLNGTTRKYYFHPDQDLMAVPDDGPVYQLSELHRVSFDYLTPGRVDIQALKVAANQGFSLEVDHAPSKYAARIVILGNQPYFSPLGRDSWLGTGNDQPSRVVLVAGADGDSVVIAAMPGSIRFALNNLYPNPMSLSEHGDMFLEYVVPGNLPAGRHRLVVYDLLGREIYRQAFDEPEYGQLQSQSIPGYAMKTWASGTYILRLSLGSATAIRRFILLQVEHRVRGSRFIARAVPAASREVVDVVLQEVRQDFPDATHICYAYQLSTDRSEPEEFSTDAGEPGGSAGVPILNGMRQQNIVDALIWVARYYGGTKLGIPGLIEAYGGAARLSLENASIVPWIDML